MPLDIAHRWTDEELEKLERRRRERYNRGLIPEQRKRQGLCLRCGKPADSGKYCRDCLASMCSALDKGRKKSSFREMEKKRLEKKFSEVWHE